MTERGNMEYVRIVLLSIGCAIVYGIIHDQVTAHLCVEYFTIGHASLLGLTDPTALAFAWGVVATWWVGLQLGVLLALACRVGPRPRLDVRDVRAPIMTLMLCVGLTSAVAGVVGYALAHAGTTHISYIVAARVPTVKQVAFIADAWAHESAYNVGAIGGILVCAWAWRERGRRRQERVAHRDWWRAVQRTIWDGSARRRPGTRLLGVAAVAVLSIGTLTLIPNWFLEPGDPESVYFVVGIAWPIVLVLFCALGIAALLMARQPRAALVFPVLCLVVGYLGAVYLINTAGGTGVSAGEAFLALDVLVAYAAWRLILRPEHPPTRAA